MGVLAGFWGVVAAGACARPAPHEPPFIETTGSPITTPCIAPSAWNCVYPATTRTDALEALEVADIARALQKPGNPPRRWDPHATRTEERESAKIELAQRPALLEEEEALLRLREYVACHTWDLDLTFELARRNWELNRFANASYLFLRVAKQSDDERAAHSFLRALEALSVLGTAGITECLDEIERRVPHRVTRLCAHRDEGSCVILKKIASDVERMQIQEVARKAETIQ